MASETASAKPRTVPSSPTGPLRGSWSAASESKSPIPARATTRPSRTARQGQHQALREQLAQDPPAAGAEGGPDRHLALAHRGAREEQAGDVDARHEQHERHGPQQDHQARPSPCR